MFLGKINEVNFLKRKMISTEKESLFNNLVPWDVSGPAHQVEPRVGGRNIN